MTHRLRDRAGRFWREYTRMRTAILFLIGVALIVLVGSFVPQQDTSQQAKVDEFLSGHANLNALATHLGLPLTQVFVAPLFLVLLGSLYVALGACVLRRARALLRRTVRGYRRTPQYWGEWGSWAFHASFFLLLVAVLYGKSTGFDGIMTVTEGQTVSESRADFDTLKEGVLFDGQHAGYQVRLNSFRATYAANGQPSDFVSNVSVIDGGRVVQTRDIRVNDFLDYRGVDFYQQDYGWSPRIVVRNPRGQVVFDSFVQFFGADKSTQDGVVKVPDFGYSIPGAGRSLQVGAQATVLPDARQAGSLLGGGSVTTGPSAVAGGEEARNPVLLLHLYVGDLGLDSGRAQDVTQLDTSHMQPYLADGSALPLALHGRLQLPLNGTDCSSAASGCFTVEFPELRQYSLFQVKRDAGVPFVYVTFGMIMAGLLAKLYLRPLLEARERRRRPPSGPSAGGYAWLASTAGDSVSDAPTSVGAR